MNNNQYLYKKGRTGFIKAPENLIKERKSQVERTNSQFVKEQLTQFINGEWKKWENYNQQVQNQAELLTQEYFSGKLIICLRCGYYNPNCPFGCEKHVLGFRVCDVKGQSFYQEWCTNCRWEEANFKHIHHHEKDDYGKRPIERDTKEKMTRFWNDCYSKCEKLTQLANEYFLNEQRNDL